MSEFRIMRHIEIDAAHRVPNHQGGCRNLHGHRYKVEAHCVGNVEESLDDPSSGMLLDFSFIKSGLIKFVHEPCDHGAIFFADDLIVGVLSPEDAKVAMAVAETTDYCAVNRYHEGLKLYIIPYVPTAENLAKHWYDRMKEWIREASEGRAYLSKIRVHETPNCWAEYPFRNGGE